MGSRAPAVFPLADLAMDVSLLCKELKSCLPLSPGRTGVQPVYYLDTADDALFGDGGVLLAKPQSAYWSLIREQAVSGRPIGGSRTGGMPMAVTELPSGPLRDQLRAAIGERALQVKSEAYLSRQPLAAPAEAPRLLLETAVSDERLIGRRLLLTRQPKPDRLEVQLLERLAELTGKMPVAGSSWYPRLRPELAV